MQEFRPALNPPASSRRHVFTHGFSRSSVCFEEVLVKYVGQLAVMSLNLSGHQAGQLPCFCLPSIFIFMVNSTTLLWELGVAGHRGVKHWKRIAQVSVAITCEKVEWHNPNS